MLVRIDPMKPRGYSVYPVNIEYQRKYKVYMAKATGIPYCDVYFQSEGDLPEEIVKHRNYRELLKGYSFQFQVDPLIYGYWLGYDAWNVDI